MPSAAKGPNGALYLHIHRWCIYNTGLSLSIIKDRPDDLSRDCICCLNRGVVSLHRLIRSVFIKISKWSKPIFIFWQLKAKLLKKMRIAPCWPL